MCENKQKSVYSFIHLLCYCKHLKQNRLYQIIGSLSNDDGDGNENGQKAIGLGPVYMKVGDPR